MKKISELKHFVGCDVSKNTLDFALYERDKNYRQFQHTQVPNNTAGFQAMRSWLRSLNVKMQDAFVAMEHTGTYSMAFAEWCSKNKTAFVLLHPLDVKNAGARGRNKTDKIDAQFIADYAYTMREKLEPSTPESPTIKLLRQLRNERQTVVRSRTAFINLLKTMTDNATVNRLKKTIAAFDEEIKKIEQQMKKVIASDETTHQNFKLLVSIPGIGLVNAVMTIIATGNFTRFQSARQYAKFSCVSPLTKQSGTSIRESTHISKAGHNEIKSVLTEGARSAVCHDANIRAYYERKRAEGKSHGCVMNAVKFKLICRMFAVIKRQTPYVNTDRYRS